MKDIYFLRLLFPFLYHYYYQLYSLFLFPFPFLFLFLFLVLFLFLFLFGYDDSRGCDLGFLVDFHGEVVVENLPVENLLVENLLVEDVLVVFEGLEVDDVRIFGLLELFEFLVVGHAAASFVLAFGGGSVDDAGRKESRGAGGQGTVGAVR